MASKTNLFEQLKRGLPIGTPRQPRQIPYFKIQFIDEECFVSVVDQNGAPANLDYSAYSNSFRPLIKTLDQLHQRFSFTLDADTDEPLISLTENDFLIWRLKDIDTVVDEQLRPLMFEEEERAVCVRIQDKGQLVCELFLTSDLEGLSQRKPKFLSDSFALINNKIFPIASLGENYSILHAFETLILPSDLDKYLTLLYSYFDNIQLDYEPFHVLWGDQKSTSPSLMIEKVTSDGSLYLKFANTLSFFDPEFLLQYPISRVAVVDKASSTITVNSLKQESDVRHIEYLAVRLTERKRLENDRESEIFNEDNLFIISPLLAENFIIKDLPELASVYAIFGSDKLSGYRVKVVQPEIKLSLNHGVDFLEGDAQLTIEDEVFSLFDALYLYQRNSYIQLNDGTKALIDQAYMDRLARVFQKGKDNIKVSFFDIPLIDTLIEEKTEDDSLTWHRSVFEGFSKLDKVDEPLPDLRVTCRPYQVEGYKWLRYLQLNRFGGCLADDMGLGKTIQTIALLSTSYPAEFKPSLIVVPKSLVFNWQREIEKANPRLSVSIYYGPDRDLKKALQSNVVITTYALVRSDIERIKEVRFFYVILDESQNIKNIQSQISRAVVVLNADHRLALSGTPIENNLSELYSLFRFLNPAMFGSLERFNRQYLIPIQNNHDEIITGELKTKIYPFILRRLKRDVLPDLPDKIEQILYVEMSDDHKKLYEQRRQFFYDTTRNQILMEGIERSRFFILQALTDLRQAASIPEVKSDGLIVSPKRELLLQMMKEAIANQHKVLVFANFLSILDAVANDLEIEDIAFEMMTGASKNRENLVKRFQTDEMVKVFLMTLKTGGQGLNLTAADMVFIFDPWWNLAAENQAVDRSHRIGQKRSVFSYKMVVRGTIEEKILRLQQSKRKLTEEIISDDQSAVKLLDQDDIEFILGNVE